MDSHLETAPIPWGININFEFNTFSSPKQSDTDRAATGTVALFVKFQVVHLYYND
jgi:hypothetical protein